MNPEKKRLQESSESAPWKKWGPYLSERQWGTVREDYSENGDAWNFFLHDHARSRVYTAGEDGLAGFSDDKSKLCFALALWNGNDPILKERLFGLTGAEGNHGEDVKEYYYYLDSTPTHSYMKWLYKYPQAAFPYDELVARNRRSRLEPEFELIDTGIFEQNNYFDVFTEYAKADPDDILIKITLHNRGTVDAPLHVLPTLWFRNTWQKNPQTEKPLLKAMPHPSGQCVQAAHPELGHYQFFIEANVPLLFTENETNNQRIFGTPNLSPFVKDGINDYVVQQNKKSINPALEGTKMAAHHMLTIKAGTSEVIRLRLSKTTTKMPPNPFSDFDQVFQQRLFEADEFYKGVIPPQSTDDEQRIMRQAFAGMLWTKQYYLFEGDKWIKEHGGDPFTGQNGPSRNREWGHMINDNIISMPDKWEYPWYAAWDLAFHTLSLSAIDLDFAKEQLKLMLSSKYMHPSGQIPAYEWNFSDVNPPVHAWATLTLYRTEKASVGKGDVLFLKKSFNKLLANYTWWLNRKDRFGKNLFEGGFLGLDNIGVFDRSSALPTGGYLEQADGSAWMAFFSQNMLDIAMELTAHDPAYEEMACKFLDHVLYISHAISNVGPDGLWDEEDGFFYDVLRLPNGSATRLKVRSMVGLLPLCATSIIEPKTRDLVPAMQKLFEERWRRTPDLMANYFVGRGYAERGIMALFTPDKLRRILKYMLDEEEFLSPYGIRALSKFHEKNPYIFTIGNSEYKVSYLPGDSDSSMFGGNSNWRGPVWMPTNFMLIRALLHLYLYYGNSFKIECPTGSGHEMNLYEVAKEITHRIIAAFLKDNKGCRPIFGKVDKFNADANWNDYLIFPEYFNGDNGAGLGANHQTGWTGLVAILLQQFATLDPTQLLDQGISQVLKKEPQ